MAKEIQEAYGWHFLAHEISQYTRCTFFEVMDRSVQEVLSLVMVIQAQTQLTKLRGIKQPPHDR